MNQIQIQKMNQIQIQTDLNYEQLYEIVRVNNRGYQNMKQSNTISGWIKKNNSKSKKKQHCIKKKLYIAWKCLSHIL